MDVKHMVMSMAAAGAAGVRRLGRRGNRVSPVLDGDWETQLGGRPWTPTSYGEYYPRSAMVYSAIKIRQDAIVRVPLRVLSRAPVSRTPDSPDARLPGTPRGTSAVPVGPDHPVQRLLDSPNRFWTGGGTCGGRRRLTWGCGARPTGAWSGTTGGGWSRSGR